MKQIDTTFVAQEKQDSFLNAYRDVLPTVVRHPATWFFTVLYLIANMYLILAGRAAFLLVSLYALFFFVLTVLLVTPLTAGTPPPAWEKALPTSLSKMWWQTGLVIFVLAGIIAVVLLNIIHLPFAELTTSFLEIVLPVGAALLLGARWRELGFGRGYHIWRVTIAVIVVPILLLVVAVVVGKFSLLHIPPSLLIPLVFVTYAIAPGIPEEIAFRGVLTTRLMRVVGPQWGIVLASLFFGLIHITVYMGYFHVDAATSLALCITFVAIAGITWAFVLQRTGNLIASIFYHGAFDAAGFALLPLVLPWLLHH